MSNEKQMTVEELIVQKIKGDTLFAMVGDEDALTKLAQKAVTELLFEPRNEPRKDRWGDMSMTKVPSLIQEAAAAQAMKKAEFITKQVVDDLLNEPKIVEAIKEAIVLAIPGAIEKWGLAMVNTASTQACMQAIEAVQQAIRDRQILIQRQVLAD
jgi:phosphatidylserine/phosphatidylglycerophosphate/cardiolipin synthase-like enzyme